MFWWSRQMKGADLVVKVEKLEKIVSVGPYSGRIFFYSLSIEPNMFFGWRCYFAYSGREKPILTWNILQIGVLWKGWLLRAWTAQWGWVVRWSMRCEEFVMEMHSHISSLIRTRRARIANSSRLLGRIPRLDLTYYLYTSKTRPSIQISLEIRWYSWETNLDGTVENRKPSILN